MDYSIITKMANWTYVLVLLIFIVIISNQNWSYKLNVFFYLKIYKCNCLCIQIRTETRLDEKVCLNWSMNLTILHARNNAEVWMRWELLIWAIYQKTFFTAYKNVNVIWQLYFATILLLKRIKWIVL